VMKAVLILLAVAVVAAHAKTGGALDSTDSVATQYHSAGEKCKTNNDCGGGLRCNVLTSKCERVCTKAGDTCKTNGDCCSSTCRDGVCLCFDKGATCTWGDECCDGSCSSSRGCCRKSGTECDTHGQCCSGICQAPVAPKAALLEADATPKKADDCADDKKTVDKKPAATAAGAAGAAAAPAKKADDKKTAKPKDTKKPKAKPAPKKMVPAGKQCCSDFGQKCSDSEPCCPPNICSDVLGMCTLAVKID